MLNLHRAKAKTPSFLPEFRTPRESSSFSPTSNMKMPLCVSKEAGDTVN